MTGRDLTSGMSDAISAPVVKPIMFLEGEFATGTLRLWSGSGPIDWNGHTWLGAGALIAISNIGETTSVSAQGFTVSLSGQDQSKVSLALQSCRQNSPGSVWLGTIDDAGTIIADPYLCREGKLDVAGMIDGGESATITITYEDELSDLERAREFRYTTESQRLFYPNDKGFEFVESLQDASDVWKP